MIGRPSPKAEETHAANRERIAQERANMAERWKVPGFGDHPDTIGNKERNVADKSFLAHATMVVMTAERLKKVMIDKKLTAAIAKCPKCKTVPETLHGRLVTGQAAGRHRNSGGAFRMWCDVCPDFRMIE